MRGKTIQEDIRRYTEEVGPVWYVLSAAAVLLAYGAKLIHFSFGLDTNTFMDYYMRQWDNYISQSRFGICALKGLFGLKPFTPFYSELLTFLMLILQGLTGGFLLFRYSDAAGKRPGPATALFTLLFVSHPAWSEQYYFTLQSFEVSLGVVLTMISCMLIYEWAADTCAGRNGAAGNRAAVRLQGAAGTLLLAFVYGIYQSFVPLSAVIFVSILFLDTFSGRQEKAMLRAACGILSAAAAAVLYFVTAILVKKLTGNTTDYISNQILWGHKPVSVIFGNLKNQIKIFYFGARPVFYSISFTILSVMMILAAVLSLRKNGVICLLSALFIAASPMLLPVLLGSSLIAREDFTVQYVSAFAAVFVLSAVLKLTEEKFSRRKMMRGLIAAVLSVSVFFLGTTQLQKINALWNTCDVTFRQDLEFARILLSDMHELTGKETLSDHILVIVGDREAPLNGACVKGDLIGRSVFATNAGQPKLFIATGAVDSLYTYMGQDACKEFRSDTIHSYEEAVSYAQENLPCWPEKGFMTCIDNVIIVHLSDH